MALQRIKRQEDTWVSLRCLMAEAPELPKEGFLESPKKKREEAWIDTQISTEQWRQQRLAMVKRFVCRNYPHVAQRLAYLSASEKELGHEIFEGAFDRAYEIIYDFARMARDRGAKLSRPYTFGTPDLGVRYEWRRGGREFHLEIIPENKTLRYEYLIRETAQPNQGEAGDIEGVLNSSSVVAEFLSWVEQGWL
ncbi:MAG: hypothetical protein WBG50_11745 [Desulfomonilaceae bacterium]